MPKLAQILEQSGGTRQVCVSAFFFSDHCIKHIDSMLRWVCSVINHRGRQNGVKASVTHSPTAHMPLHCFYHILTSSLIYNWTDERQHGIYLFKSAKWGPVQTPCFCRAELNSGIKFYRSTASESNFWIKFGNQLSSTSAAVLHGSGTAAIQTSCFCRAKQNS